MAWDPAAETIAYMTKLAETSVNLQAEDA